MSEPDTSNFSAITLNDNEGARLYAARGPEAPRRLLIGVTEFQSKGNAIFLEQKDVDRVIVALSDRVFTKLPGLTVSPANRGEPYRDGIEIEMPPLASAPEEYPYQYSIFLEHHDCDTLIAFLKS